MNSFTSKFNSLMNMKLLVIFSLALLTIGAIAVAGGGGGSICSSQYTISTPGFVEATAGSLLEVPVEVTVSEDCNQEHEITIELISNFWSSDSKTVSMQEGTETVTLSTQIPATAVGDSTVIITSNDIIEEVLVKVSKSATEPEINETTETTLEETASTIEADGSSGPTGLLVNRATEIGGIIIIVILAGLLLYWYASRD